MTNKNSKKQSLFQNIRSILEIVYFVDKKNLYRSVILLVFILLTMIMEVIGVSLVLPLMNILNSRFGEDWLTSLLNHYPNFEFFDLTSKMMISLMAVLFIYIIKNVFIAFAFFYQNLFLSSLQEQVSLRLLKNYLGQSYIFHITRDSATSIRNIIEETTMFRTQAIGPIISLLTESLIFAGLCFLLLVKEPVVSLSVVIIIGFLFFTFNKLTRKKIQEWGRERHLSEKDRLKTVQEIFFGIKDILVFGRIENYIRKFVKYNESSMKIVRYHSFLNGLPKLWLEILAIFGVISIIFLMLAEGKTSVQILPIIGLFAASGFRILPSVNQLIVSFQNLSFSSSIISVIETDLHLKTFNSRSVIENVMFEESIKIKDLCFTYPEARRMALNSINLEIKKGESVGIVGKSGSGKSTLVDVMLGLLPSEKGAILVDGRMIENFQDWRSQIGYVPQSIFLSDDTILRNIAFGLHDDEIDLQAVRKSLIAAQLLELVDGLDDGLNTMIGERGVKLSGGQRQRIGIARALYSDPRILILDEATSALDNETEAGFMKAVESLHHQKTIIIIAHRLTTVQYCDKIYVINDGLITRSGLPSEILNIPD